MTNTLERANAVHTIVPAVSIAESPAAYTVAVDLPGAVKEKVAVTVERNTLSITADAPVTAVTDGAESVTQYRREFTLADDIDTERVDALYENGVLTLTLNKRTQYRSKQITIQ